MSKSIDAYTDEERVRRYDADMDLLHPNRHKMAEVTFQVLPYSSGAQLRALDLGIGTGFLTSKFLRHFPNASIIGIDGSDAMLRLAATRFGGDVGRVHLKTMPFEEVSEGSFGNEKNHYGLAKVKAKTLVTEKAWIFFGILTANAHKMIKKWANAPPD